MRETFLTQGNNLGHKCLKSRGILLKDGLDDEGHWNLKHV